MSTDACIAVPGAFAKAAWVTAETYQREYARSLDSPEAFWSEQAMRLDWLRIPTRMRDVSFDPEDVHIRWFENGRLNAAENCLDRHLDARSGQMALLWEGDDPGESRAITYAELHVEVCRFANALKSLDVERGDRVAIYMPMVPEAVIAMLACARIGAVHSVVFAGFSPESLASRIRDCEASVLVVADEGLRGGRRVPLKENADAALATCPTVGKVVVYRRTGADVPMRSGRDVWWHDIVAGQRSECPPEAMEAEDALFILYTSGSTGKPKGVLHTTAGFLLHCSLTHQLVFDYHDGDVYWCTADIGWVTGHSYLVYGPLANGATTLMYEGMPNHPDLSRIWQICDKHGVNILYTAPTLIRMLMRYGAEPVRRTKRTSLKLLGSVGEPINPEAWTWYHEIVGEGRCPIVDTWWQTETGGILISPLPGATPLKPGSATLPFFGVEPVIVDDDGFELHGVCSGNLCFRHTGPGMMRTLYGAHDRFVENYFKTYPGLYFTGDGCRRDEDGYYWVTGRVDDVINVSGHRLGTAEVESALVAHRWVAEAAVVGYPHEVKGQGIFAFVTLTADANPEAGLEAELAQCVRREIGALAVPDEIQFAPSLPKTRSGKIMRRILRCIAHGDYDQLGDVSTLADPAVVPRLIDEHRSRAHDQQASTA